MISSKRIAFSLPIYINVKKHHVPQKNHPKNHPKKKKKKKKKKTQKKKNKKKNKKKKKKKKKTLYETHTFEICSDLIGESSVSRPPSRKERGWPAIADIRKRDQRSSSQPLASSI